MLPHIIIGNHDHRENFRSNFSDIKTDNNGFIQYSKSYDKKTFLFLDTNQPNTDSGHYNKVRQEWLISELEKNNKNEVYIFMHHNPLALGDEKSDKIGLKVIQNFMDL